MNHEKPNPYLLGVMAAGGQDLTTYLINNPEVLRSLATDPEQVRLAVMGYQAGERQLGRQTPEEK